MRIKKRAELAMMDTLNRRLYARTCEEKDLDILVNDMSYKVRMEVARRGRMKDLDKLVHDKSSAVRSEVAYQDHEKHLDQLVDDESEDVRAAVAFKGHQKYVGYLAADKSWLVRAIATRFCEKPGLVKRGVQDPSSFVKDAVWDAPEARYTSRTAYLEIKYPRLEDDKDFEKLSGLVYGQENRELSDILSEIEELGQKSGLTEKEIKGLLDAYKRTEAR